MDAREEARGWKEGEGGEEDVGWLRCKGHWICHEQLDGS